MNDVCTFQYCTDGHLNDNECDQLHAAVASLSVLYITAMLLLLSCFLSHLLCLDLHRRWEKGEG